MIALIYCGDQRMVPGIELSVLSILETNNEPLDLWIVTANTSGQPIMAKDIQRLTTIVRERTGRVQLINLTKVFNSQYPLANQNTIFNVNCMLRLFIDQLPDLPDRILYLDTDVLCCRNFSSFFHQDLAQADFAGALDYYGKWFYHHHFNWRLMDYVNSGVLLLNIKQIKADGLFAKCRHFCRYHRAFLPDQEALNRFVNHKLIVSHLYNDQHGLHSRTVFQHFTTQLKWWPHFHPVTVKPWQVNRVHTVLGIYDYDQLFIDYDFLFKQPVGIK